MVDLMSTSTQPDPPSEAMNPQKQNEVTPAAVLKAAQQQAQSQNPGGSSAGFPLAQNQMTAMLQAGTGAPSDQQPSAQQDRTSSGHDIKRIQQMQQQLGNGSGAPPSNALLNDTTAFFQSMLEQQKAQAPRFDNPFAQNHLGMLQPAFFQDPARFLLAQNNQLNAPSASLQASAARDEVPLPSPHSLFNRDGSRRMRGGVIEPFPEKLHRLLTEVEAAGRADVISFVAAGRAFAIHKPDKFFKEIVPLYFRQSRLSSFKRQLNLYGFELINSGPARGGYFHEFFVKDQPELCRRMRRVAVKATPSKTVEGSSNKKQEDEKDDAEKVQEDDKIGVEQTGEKDATQEQTSTE